MTPKQLTSGMIEIIKTVAIVLILAFLIKTFIIQTFIIEGVSMEPNFHNGEYLLIDKLTYRFKTPSRGDVIVLVPPGDEKNDYIKRIIGLPGENIEITNNQVLVNGRILQEDYLKNGEQTFTGNSILEDYKITLNNDEFFVLGDNRKNSKDSRSIGTIPKSHIVGRTFIVLFPFKDWRLIGHRDYAASALSSRVSY